LSYVALYRKFRPLKFEDMVGQDHIAQILRNQIINNRVGHAYLLSGVRGTGKTTTAKIFSRAINCLNPHDGEPCNECEVCKGILDGSLTDVTEIDAASNNGVENIRSIRDEVMYAPTKAKYRVYIIDEVHMLSIGAFNALLKTLEEPPEHVKFILATTEPTKLPATILSRCQRFDFKRIPNEYIIQRLEEILSGINKSAEKEALNIIANLSEGAMRDAISILDRCVADTDMITTEYISNLIGIPSSIRILDILEDIIDNNSEKVLIDLNDMLNSGQNITVILDECIKKLRDILIYSKTKKIYIYNKEELEKIDKLITKVSTEKIVNLISKISEIQNSIKWANNQIVVAQSQLIKLCVTTENDGLEDLRQRIEKLENNKNVVYVEKESKKNNIEKTINIEQKNSIPDVKNNNVVKTETNISTPSASFKEIPQWKDVLVDLRGNGKVSLFTNLVNAKASFVNDGLVGVFLKTDFAKTMVEKGDNLNVLKDTISNVLNKEYEVRCYLENDKKAIEDSRITDLENKMKGLNIPIDIIDE